MMHLIKICKLLIRHWGLYLELKKKMNKIHQDLTKIYALHAIRKLIHLEILFNNNLSKMKKNLSERQISKNILTDKIIF